MLLPWTWVTNFHGISWDIPWNLDGDLAIKNFKHDFTLDPGITAENSEVPIDALEKLSFNCNHKIIIIFEKSSFSPAILG